MADSCPGETFHGTIAGIGDAAQSAFDLISTENTSGNYSKVTQRVTLKIKVDNKEYVLKPGLSATVKIHLSRV
jgi:multidrug resistance efflux pump